MSPRELSAWIRLVAILVVFVPYAAYVLRLFASHEPIARTLCVAFLAASVAFLIVVAVAEALSRSRHVCLPGDERDRAIERVGMRVAYVALVVLVLGAVSTYAVLGYLTPPSADGSIATPSYSVTSQFALISVVIAEALRHLTQVVCYRKGLPA